MVASLLLRRKDAWPSQMISAIALSFSWEGAQTHYATQFQTPRLPKLPNNCTNSTWASQMWKVWKKGYFGGHPHCPLSMGTRGRDFAPAPHSLLLIHQNHRRWF